MTYSKSLSRFNRLESDIKIILEANPIKLSGKAVYDFLALHERKLADVLGPIPAAGSKTFEPALFMLLRVTIARLRLQSAVLETFLHLEKLGFVSSAGLRTEIDLSRMVIPQNQSGTAASKPKSGNRKTKAFGDRATEDNFMNIFMAIASFTAVASIARFSDEARSSGDLDLLKFYHTRWLIGVYMAPVQWLSTVILRTSQTNDLDEIIDRIRECGQLGVPEPREFAPKFAAHPAGVRSLKRKEFEVKPDARQIGSEARGKQPPAIFLWLPHGVSTIEGETASEKLNRITKMFDDKFVEFENAWFNLLRLQTSPLLPRERLPAGFIKDEVSRDGDSKNAGTMIPETKKRKAGSNGICVISNDKKVKLESVDEWLNSTV